MSSYSWYIELIPRNDKAKEVVQNNNSKHDFVRKVDGHSRFHIRLLDHTPKLPDTIVSIGGEHCDLYIPKKFSNGEEYSFEIHPQSGQLLFKVANYRNARLEITELNAERYHLQSPPNQNQPNRSKQRVIIANRLYRLFLNEVAFNLKLHSIGEDSDILEGKMKFKEKHKQTFPPFKKPAGDWEIQYEELGRLGSGAFGSVVSVFDLHSGDLFAVKRALTLQKKVKGEELTTKELEKEERRVAEAKHFIKVESDILRQLSHEHVVTFIRAQRQPPDQTLEIVMEQYVSDLRGLEFNKGSKRFRLLMEHILSALVYLEERKVIHRDIKPENILYKYHDGDCWFVLTDFGLSKFENHTTSPAGNAWYSAPDIRSGRIQTTKADVWSFGVLLLRASGRWPENPDRPFQTQEWFEAWYQAVHETAWYLAPELEPILRRDVDQRCSAKDYLRLQSDTKSGNKVSSSDGSRTAGSSSHPARATAAR